MDFHFKINSSANTPISPSYSLNSFIGIPIPVSFKISIVTENLDSLSKYLKI